MLLTWKPDLAVGEPTIDQQHQEIFRRAGLLHDALTQGKGRGEVSRLVEYLSAYTLSHFREEEHLMDATRFPGIDAHRQLHEAFAAEMARIRAGLVGQEATTVQVIALNHRICEWLVKHIGRADREYARWARSSAAPAAPNAPAARRA